MTTATPGLTPKRRDQHTPAKLASNVRVPQRGRTQPQRPFSGLTTTIGAMNPIINRRLACNKVTDWIEGQNWTRKTIADTSALVETWFELETASDTLKVLPETEEAKQTRRSFAEACFDTSVKGLAIQKEEWYIKLASEIQAARQDAKATRSAGVSTRPKKQATTTKSTASSSNNTFCGRVVAKVAADPSVTALDGNAAVLVKKMIKLYPSLTGGAKERRKAAFEKALVQLKWGFRRQHDSIQNGYAVFCTAVNTAIAALKR